MVDADSVVISATHPVRLHSHLSSVGKVDFSTAEEKAANLKMEGRKTYTGSQQMIEDGQTAFLAHFRGNYKGRRQVVAVEAKAKVKAGETLEAKAKMLEDAFSRLNVIWTVMATY